MKLVFAVHQFLPEFSSGTELLTYETAKQFQQWGHEVSIFTGFPSSTPIEDADRFDRYVYEGMAVERFKHDHGPMGGQSNSIELQYNNVLFREHFRKYLQKIRPDVVHFYHFARLSASGVEVCEELGIPSVFTPTDFWFLCPLSQLRLPDNQVCDGPNAYGGNCLRHMLTLNKSTKIRLAARFLPPWIFDMVMGFGRIGRGWDIDSKYFAQLQALAFRRSSIREKISKVRKIMVPTKTMEKMLIENQFDRKKIVLLPFGINLDNFIPRNREIFTDVIRIGYIGTFSEHKGAHILLDAVRQMENAPIEVAIYGNLADDAAYSNKLLNMARNDQRVKFPGTFLHHEIGNILASFDILVIPSLWRENTPLVLYSAQAARCPVVASDVDGISEVITDGVNGILFEMGNSNELRRILLGLVCDRKILISLSDNSITPLAIEEYADRLKHIYLSILQEKL